LAGTTGGWSNSSQRYHYEPATQGTASRVGLPLPPVATHRLLPLALMVATQLFFKILVNSRNPTRSSWNNREYPFLLENH